MREWMNFCVIVVLVTQGAPELSGQMTWRRSYGGYGSDNGKSVQATVDGNYIVCGSTGSFGPGGGDVYLTLLDPEGHLIWSKTYGGAGVEQGNCVRQMTDGGFIIAGLTNSFGAGGYDGFVVKTDPLGSEEWTRTFGGQDWDVFNSLVVLDDGLLCAGQSYSDPSIAGDAWLVKISFAGDEQWSKLSGWTGADCIRAIDTFSNGGYAAAGYSSDTVAYATMFLFAADGDLLDANVQTESPGSYGNGVAVTSDGLAVLVGEKMGDNGKIAILVRKVDLDGATVWTDVTSQTDDCAARSVVERWNGQLALACYTTQYGSGGEDMFLVFEHADGGYAFGTTFGTLEDNPSWDVAETLDGGVILCGTTRSSSVSPTDVFVVKTDTSGFTEDEEIVAEFDPVGIAVATVQSGLGLAGNPGTRDRPVRLVGMKSAEHGLVQARDALGRVARVWEKTTGIEELLLTELDPGVFSIELQKESGLMFIGHAVVQ
ncbi:MAG: hypothetical protein ABI599_03245 [Flavobacteriales bacterium]